MLIRNDSPFGWNLYLEEPSDNAGGGSAGQELEPDLPADPGDTGEPAAPSYFHSYEDTEGNKTDFKDANELNDFIRQGNMRHSDYTRKTQGVAKDRESLQAERAKYDAEYTTFLTSKQENDKIETYLKSLPPEVFTRLKQGIQGQPKKQARDPEVDQMLKEFKESQKQQESDKAAAAEEAARTKAFADLGKVHSDFDSESVMKIVNDLQKAPQEDQIRAFMEMFYYADKGRSTPAEMERQMAENLERKANTTTPMEHGIKPPNTGVKTYSSIKEAKKAALEELT